MPASYQAATLNPAPRPAYPRLLLPVGLVGRAALAVVGYLGSAGMFALLAVKASFHRPEGAASLRSEATEQVAWMTAMGLPLVGLIHVSMGSFLAMQAYFGGTFVDGTGAVVGVGLLRNIAPLMSGMALSGLLAARTVAELRMRTRQGVALPSAERMAKSAVVVPNPTVWSGWSDAGEHDDAAPASASAARPLEKAEKARLAAVRIVAAMVAGPILGIWGAAVGTIVGWRVARDLMGVSTNSFFHMFTEMMWPRDVVGVVLKGMAFAFFSALFAVKEGLRNSDAAFDLGRPARLDIAVAEADFHARGVHACRAACFGLLSILVINSAWFMLFYHATAFGPTLLKTPGH